jgi:hypothetical protein
MGRRDPLTQDFFEVPEPAAPLEASMDYRTQVAVLVYQILRDADGDRYEIAARMSKLAGYDVTKYMLDAYTSESRDAYNIPFHLVPVLETACDSHLLSNWLANKRGGRLLIGREALNAELGKLERMRDDAGKKIKQLKILMGENNA